MFIIMSSKTTTYYTLRPSYGVLAHTSLPICLLHDLDTNPDNLVIEALAASGDCFEMIASNLDQISRNIPENNPMQFQLEHTIRILLYLQHHYKIVRKLPLH
jgi:hypothetical protein